MQGILWVYNFRLTNNYSSCVLFRYIKENIMDNIQEVQEILELTVEELEERTAPGLVVVWIPYP